MPGECFTEEELLAFHRGSLALDRIEAVADHMESCPRCEEVIQRLEQSPDPMLHALRQTILLQTPSLPDLSQSSSGTAVSDSPALEELPNLLGYTVSGVLGRGGMGVVYRARQVHLNRPVALKQLSCRTSREAARARAEAESLARFQHPNIVQIHEVLEDEGRLYLALELVEGGSLAAKLSGKPLPPRESAALVECLARAIHYAHEHGIIHRDIKPGNILLARANGEQAANGARPSLAAYIPKITDFGIAKLLEGAEGQTRDGDLIGTPSYMAPEQASGRVGAIGPATDVYSLGVLLYELLTGRVPLQGPSTLETLLLVRNQEPVSPRRLQPHIDRDLETICLKCLRKEPGQRYGSAGELADDLRRFVNHEPIRARPTPAWERLAKWARRNPGIASLATAVVLVAALGFSLVSWQWQRAEQKADEAVKAEKSAEERRKLAEEAEARLALQQGQTLCEQGEIGNGLLWFARGLERAVSAGANELERPLRINLTHWSRQLRRAPITLRNPAHVQAVAFDPTGRFLLAGGRDGLVHFWEIATGREAGLPLEPPRPKPVNWVVNVEFSRDGRFIYTSSMHYVVVWNAATRKQEGVALDHHHGMLWGMASLPDGKHLATCNDDGLARLWDLDTRRVVVGPMEHGGEGGYYTLAVSPDGHSLVTAGSDRLAYRWDLRTGKRLDPPLQHSSTVLTAAFSTDGRKIFTATELGTLHAWDVRTGRVVDLPPEATRFSSIAVAPNGRHFATSTSSGTVRLWHVETLLPFGPVYRFETGAPALAFDREGRRLAVGCEDGSLHILEPPSFPEPETKTLLDSEAASLAYADDGKRFLLGSNKGARWLDAATGAYLGMWFRNPEGYLVSQVVLSPDGQSLAMTRWAGESGAWRSHVEVWETTTAGQRRWQSPEQPMPLGVLAYSPDGRLLFSCCGTDSLGEAVLWDVATGRRLQSLSVLKALGGSRVTNALFHPDGHTLLLACTDGRARLWDLTTDREVDPQRPLAHTSAVTACAFDTAGGRVLTGCRDGTVHLWDVATRRALWEPLRHPAQVSAVAFSPDGATLLSSSLDGTARFWDAVTGKALGAPLRQPGGIVTAAFRPDGLRVATTGRDTTLREWLTPPPPLEGDPQGLRLWVEVQSGLELDSQGAVRSLSPEALTERRRRLQDQEGTSLPGL